VGFTFILPSLCEVITSKEGYGSGAQQRGACSEGRRGHGGAMSRISPGDVLR